MNRSAGLQAAEGLARFAKPAVFAYSSPWVSRGFFLGSPAHKFHASQDEACRARCADIRKFHRLVPALPAGAVPQGRYDGPWNCECY